MKPVTIKLPPECEFWFHWFPELRQFDGKTLTPEYRDCDGDYEFLGDDGYIYTVKGEWCHEEPVCQWLPWDPDTLDREKKYVVIGERNGPHTVFWHHTGWMYDMDYVDRIAKPTHYLANIPEVPK